METDISSMGRSWNLAEMDAMQKNEIFKIEEHDEFIESASEWFHQKWKVPKEAYIESMKECFENEACVPQWYIVMDDEKIVAGLGVIENDFHARKDLSPNVCAVYVEPEYRCKGTAGEMLNFVCKEFSDKGINTLYLVTDHESFYERYGWEFLCMVQGDGEENLSRMYRHQM